LQCFKEAHRTVYKRSDNESEKHPVFLELKKQNEFKIIPNTSTPKRINVKEEFIERRKKKCDEVFASYIEFMKEWSIDQYCNKIITFCLLYRECLNLLKDKLEEDKKNLPGEVIMHVESKESEYCLNNNAEQMPDICNEFLTKYLNNWKDIVDIKEMKELTYHFCQWIFFNGYTCSLVKINANCPKEASLNHCNERSNKKNEGQISKKDINDIKEEFINNKGKEGKDNVQDVI